MCAVGVSSYYGNYGRGGRCEPQPQGIVNVIKGSMWGRGESPNPSRHLPRAMGQVVYTAGEQLGMRRCRGNTETSPEVVNRDASSGEKCGQRWKMESSARG